MARKQKFVKSGNCKEGTELWVRMQREYEHIQYNIKLIDWDPTCFSTTPWGQTCWTTAGTYCDGAVFDTTNNMTTTMSGITCQPWANFSSPYDVWAAIAPGNLCIIYPAYQDAPWCYITPNGQKEACMMPCARE